MSVVATVLFVALLVAFWPAIKGASAKVDQFPYILNVSIGGNGSMYCMLPVVKDTAEVSWWKEGQKAFIEPDSRHQFNVKKGSGIFTLLNVRYADAGWYYCQAESQQQVLGNGCCSHLIVFTPPIPLEIVPIGEFSSLRQLLCKTAAFYPKELETVWQKNGRQIHTGIKTVIYQTAAGSYKASSSLEINDTVREKDVYTCLVSHFSLTTPVSCKFTLEQGKITSRYAGNGLIFACAAGGSVILFLIIALLILKLKRSYEGNTNALDGDQNEDPVQQAPVDQTTASLNHRESKPFRKDRQQEERVIYSQAKGNGADKLTYAALQFPDSNFTQASKHQSKHTLFADVNTSKKL